MTAIASLRHLGVLTARIPRYTSYPPANQFARDVGPDRTAAWMAAVPPGSSVSLYVHLPYCRRLCWFCACRTQGTATDRPLRPYLRALRQEIGLVSGHLPAGVEIGHVHLGGGTPTLLPADLLDDLCTA